MAVVTGEQFGKCIPCLRRAVQQPAMALHWAPLINEGCAFIIVGLDLHLFLVLPRVKAWVHLQLEKLELIDCQGSTDPAAEARSTVGQHRA